MKNDEKTNVRPQNVAIHDICHFFFQQENENLHFTSHSDEKKEKAVTREMAHKQATRAQSSESSGYYGERMKHCSRKERAAGRQGCRAGVV